MVEIKQITERRKRHGELLGTPPPTLYISPSIDKIFEKGFTRGDFAGLISANGGPQVEYLNEVVAGIEMRYIRDSFQVFDNLIFTPGKNGIPMVRELLGDKKGEKEINISNFGIGGNILRSGKLIVAKESLRNSEWVGTLEAMGYAVEFLPVPPLEEHTDLSRRMGFNEHIDTEVNFVQSEKGYVFIVNNDYYQQYAADIDGLVEKYGGEVKIITSPDEQTKLRGVNFIELPNGKVVVPENCTETRGLLEDSIGKDNVISVKVDVSKFNGIAQTLSDDGRFITLWFHGGLRCLTNNI
jgi:hypothetical protein